jgi:hypothetical protein
MTEQAAFYAACVALVVTTGACVVWDALFGPVATQNRRFRRSSRHE